MAFNLSKDDAGRKKFNLAKPEAPGSKPATAQKKRSNLLVYLVIGMCVLAGVIWYFATQPPKASTVAQSTQKTAEEKPVVSNNNDSAVEITAAGLNGKVAAGFDAGSASPATIDSGLLQNIVSYLDKDAASVITINGYASSEGDANFNDSISAARANVFMQMLVQRGISAGRIKAVGKGTQDPIASNETLEGRQKNRRVEIAF